MRRTTKYGTVELQGYTGEQIEFIASVEDDYPDDAALGDIVADYADELAALAMTWDEAYAEYDETLDADGPVTVAGQQFYVSHAYRLLDPVGYRTGFNVWADGEGINTDLLWGVDRF